ncbi:hypothetical protein, partial [Kitasatospora sp. NPDC005748]|uniref:hypothetical protein n=1 Tax=Kitasatospora sp. NPDC005748 TaxID=3157063 RepID=UPI0033F21F12
GGASVAYPSVLQAGTAVLVDAQGTGPAGPVTADGDRPAQPAYWAKIFANSYGCWAMLVHL